MKKETLQGIGFTLFLFCTPIILVLAFKSDKPKEERTQYVYEYYVNDDSVYNGAQFVVTSMDTSYGSKQDGMPDLIEVRLSSK